MDIFFKGLGTSESKGGRAPYDIKFVFTSDESAMSKEAVSITLFNFFVSFISISSLIYSYFKRSQMPM